MQCSARTKILYWIQGLSASARQDLLSHHEPLALRQLIKFTECTSSAFLAYANFHLNRIICGNFDKSFPDTYGFSLHIYRCFHRHIYDQQEILQRAMGMASIKGVVDDAMQQQKEDIEILSTQLQHLLARLEQDVQILHSNFAIQQAKLVSRVTKLAFLFLPLSTIATILAINGPNERFVIFGAIAVPLVFLSVLFFISTKDFEHPDAKYS